MAGAAGASAGVSGGAGAAVVIAEATKASGAIVHVKSRDFEAILSRLEYPLVTMVEPTGFFNNKYKYLTAYGGLFFYTQTKTAIALPPNTEIIRAKKIWVPSL